MTHSWHPYLATAPDAFTRLVRAYFWQVEDMTPGHADYWRAQVEAAKADLSEHITNTTRPEAVGRLLPLLHRNAMLTAFEAASKRSHRGGFDVPETDLAEGGFLSGSVVTPGQSLMGETRGGFEGVGR